jgi:RNA polymerase sigma factor (sigma-70 family)
MDQDTIARNLVADRAKLMAYIRSIVGNSAVVEDIYQDVLVLALKKCVEIENESHLLNWARQAARFQAINHLKRHGREPVSLSAGVIDQLESHWGVIDQEVSRTRVAALIQCMKKLSSYAQELLELRFARGMSGKEVAAEVDREPHAVYTTLSRSYSSLFKCIERKLQDEDLA